MEQAAAAINLASEEASARFLAGQTSVEDLIRAVEQAGYGAEVTREEAPDRERQMRERELRRLARSLAVSAALSLPLLVAMIAGLLRGEALRFLHDPLLRLALATPVQFLIGWRLCRDARHCLKACSPGMDESLVAGESLPLEKSSGDAVIGATINGHGPSAPSWSGGWPSVSRAGE